MSLVVYKFWRCGMEIFRDTVTRTGGRMPLHGLSELANILNFSSLLLIPRKLSHASPSSRSIYTFMVTVMVARTLIYLLHRRQGLVGPAHAIRLTKFWSVYGLLASSCVLASVYLDPFGLGWFVDLVRAGCLTILICGRNLPAACSIFDEALRPFYDSNAHEVDVILRQVRSFASDIDDVARDFAKYLLDHLAVGGFMGLARAVTGFQEGPSSFASISQNSSEVSTKNHASRVGPRLSEIGFVQDGTTRVLFQKSGANSSSAYATAERSSPATDDTSSLVPSSLSFRERLMRPAYGGSRELRASFRSRQSKATKENPENESKRARSKRWICLFFYGVWQFCLLRSSKGFEPIATSTGKRVRRNRWIDHSSSQDVLCTCASHVQPAFAPGWKMQILTKRPWKCISR